MLTFCVLSLARPLSFPPSTEKYNFLGISIVGQSNDRGDGGIYIGSIMKGGAVAADGRIEPGDMLLQVYKLPFLLLLLLLLSPKPSDRISIRGFCGLLKILGFFFLQLRLFVGSHVPLLFLPVSALSCVRRCGYAHY